MPRCVFGQQQGVAMAEGRSVCVTVAVRARLAKELAVGQYVIVIVAAHLSSLIPTL